MVTSASSRAFLCFLGAFFAAHALSTEPEFSAALVTLCFAERPAGKDPCDFRSYIDPRTAKVEIVGVPREQATPEAIERFLCATLRARSEEYLMIHVAGRGRELAGGWALDWFDGDGASRALAPLDAGTLSKAINQCLPPAPKRIVLVIDGFLAGGVAAPHAAFEAFTAAKQFSSLSVLQEESLRKFEFEFSFRYNAEKTAAERSKGKADPWNEDVDDIPFLPLSSAAPPACRPLWAALIARDARSLLDENVTGLPSGSACTAVVPAPLRRDHEDYVKACGAIGAAGAGVGESERDGCLPSLVRYRATLRHWATRGQEPASLTDTALLVDKVLWAEVGGPPGKYVRRHEFLLAAATRLSELKPQNIYAPWLAMQAAGSLATHYTESERRPDLAQGYWKKAEALADRVLALGPALHDARQRAMREVAWYSKSWGMQPDRLRALALEIRKNPVDRDEGDYYLARAELDLGRTAEAQRILASILQRSPENERVRAAVAERRWSGGTASFGYAASDLWRDLSR